MATIGQMGEFKPDEEGISAYLDRLQLFFVANSVEEGKQVAVLLSVIGAKTYAPAIKGPASSDETKRKDICRTIDHVDESLRAQAHCDY